MADEAVLLGSPPAAKSYLDVDRILDAARSTGAEAIHPGYGFLSENAEFADRCETAGLPFIGPTPAQMREFGLKHVARTLARATGVPLLPGTELLDDVHNPLPCAQRIGYPVGSRRRPLLGWTPARGPRSSMTPCGSLGPRATDRRAPSSSCWTPRRASSFS